MKIALCLHEFFNYGGIISRAENTAAGFRELGHEVDLYILTHQASGRITTCISPDAYVGEFGVLVSQDTGWQLTPWKNRLFYKGRDNFERTKDVLSKYDALLWLNPCPTKCKKNSGNINWPELYTIVPRQIVCIPDGNYRTSYPWLYLIKDYVTAFACVHTCAYNSISNIDKPRALIPSCQNVDHASLGLTWNERQKGWLSCQTFKRWKRVDDVIKAVPYMHSMKKLVAGGGIEWAYMNSPTKMKSEYIVDGVPIVETARANGLEALGWISPAKRDSILDEIQFLIDSSWSKKYAAIGGHFNRTAAEAVLRGAIPIGRNLGMSDNEQGIDRIWKPNENYIMIPYDVSSQEFADYINEAICMSPAQADDMRVPTFAKIKKFVDRKFVAQQYELLFNDLRFENEFTSVEVGEYDPAFMGSAQFEFGFAFEECGW